ncbi:Dicer-like protein 1 [Mortierella sp. NVP85]|nr:Dicer-like protein 1 [Mortierella sp. NVP85]
MPKAPRHTSTQFGAASKRPAYQARSRASASTPAPTTASAAPGTSATSALTHATASGPIPATASGPIPATAPPATVSDDVSTVFFAVITAVVSAAITAAVSDAVDAAASALVPAPAPASASASAPAPVPPVPTPAQVPALAPAVLAARRSLAAQDDDLTHFFGSEVLKMFFGVHAFIQYPEYGAGPLTEERQNQFAGIRRPRDMYRALACSYLSCGYDLAFLDFALLHDLTGITSVDQYIDDYIVTLDEDDVDVGPGDPDVTRVEEIIGYEFANKRLLEEALTEPGNNVWPHYERLEFFGDSILGVVAATAWIERGEPLRQIPTKSQKTVNNATLTAAGFEAGLDVLIRNRSQSTNNKIRQKKPSLTNKRARCPPNETYWSKDDEVKTLADVVEAVFGAVFLDSGMRLSDVEDVFRRILWPVVERRMA